MATNKYVPCQTIISASDNNTISEFKGSSTNTERHFDTEIWKFIVYYAVRFHFKIPKRELYIYTNSFVQESIFPEPNRLSETVSN